MGFDIENYTTVSERVQEFYLKYPDGSIQFEFMGLLPGDETKMWGVAKAYRSPDDLLPGTGTASEYLEGKTPYTRGSELQNLETSAWGRCLASLNIGNNKALSTKEEVLAKQQMATPEARVLAVVPPAAEWIPADNDVPNNDTDLWVDESIEQRPLDSKSCVHGMMERRSGISKSTGKPYGGMFCHLSICKPEFDRS